MYALAKGALGLRAGTPLLPIDSGQYYSTKKSPKGMSFRIVRSEMPKALEMGLIKDVTPAPTKLLVVGAANARIRKESSDEFTKEEVSLMQRVLDLESIDLRDFALWFNNYNFGSSNLGHKELLDGYLSYLEKEKV